MSEQTKETDKAKETEEVYEQFGSLKFKFNDVVECVTLSLMRQRPVVGRLVQVRLKNGQFKSDLFFLRHPDGSLGTVENETLKHSDAEVPIVESDSPQQEYTIQQQWPATGFIIKNSQKPPTPNTPFSLTVKDAHGNTLVKEMHV
jgi:hypothetical protein